MAFSLLMEGVSTKQKLKSQKSRLGILGVAQEGPFYSFCRHWQWQMVPLYQVPEATVVQLVVEVVEVVAFISTGSIFLLVWNLCQLPTSMEASFIQGALLLSCRRISNLEIHDSEHVHMMRFWVLWIIGEEQLAPMHWMGMKARSVGLNAQRDFGASFVRWEVIPPP